MSRRRGRACGSQRLRAPHATSRSRAARACDGTGAAAGDGDSAEARLVTEHALLVAAVGAVDGRVVEGNRVVLVVHGHGRVGGAVHAGAVGAGTGPGRLRGGAGSLSHRTQRWTRPGWWLSGCRR